MNETRSQHHISGLMALLLFAVFGVCVLAGLLGATDLYQRLSQRDAVSYEHRTAAMYLTTKVRQSDRRHALRTESFGDGDALVYREELDGESFETRIYCYDGQLRELFSPASLEAMPEDGEPLLPLQALELQLEHGLLTAVLTEPDGTQQHLLLRLRSWEGQP